MATIKHYANYQQLINDTEPADYGILDNTGVMMKHINGVWLHQSACSNDPTITNRHNDDYTAFEVMPNKTEIVAGTVDDVTGLTYVKNVSASTIHKMTLRSAQEPDECDVVIDWGDGIIESIKAGNYVSHIEGKSYELEHDYSPNMTSDIQRFIVKIYGKNYYTFRHHLYSSNNLISRIFDNDLPLSTNINSVASMAYHANRLLLVKFPSYTTPYSNIWNWGSVFSMCNNLQSVTGFTDILIKDNSKAASIFGNSNELIETDFVFNRGTTDLANLFSYCHKLEGDISKFFPIGGFLPGTIKVGPVFYKCSKLSGTVPADKLWNDKNITWTNTAQAFLYCSDEIRSQVPVSWGGTNKLIDGELKLKEMNVDKNYYSAFEVFAHDYDIPVGECADLNGYVNYEIEANMTHMFTLRTMVQDTTKCDIVIDWGDGTISSVANMEFEQGEYADESADTVAGEANYTFRHTYSKNGKYVVKIYGTHYYNISANSRVKGGSEYLRSNIISRIFTWDLPIASHYRNLSQMCVNATNLLFINVETLKYEYFVNITGLFSECFNLLEAIGFKRNFTTACASQMFTNCWNLKKTDMQLATKSVYPAASNMLYHECRELAVDISKLIPEVQGSGTIDVNYLFGGCVKLTGTVPAAKLWENTNVIWTNTDTAFIGCSDEIRSQVPVSWGGTKTE